MKNITKMTVFAALALVFAASCAKETEPAPDKAGRELHFTVTTAANVPVKSYLDNNLDGSYTPKWSNGDAIAVFTQSITASTTKADGILTNQKEDGTTAEFNGVLTAADEGVFKAVSPAGRFVQGYAPVDGAEYVGVSLGDPDNNYVQKPTNETIDPDCDILVSKPVSYALDGTDVLLYDIYFKRIMSVVKINVNGPESLAGEKIKNFTLTSSAATLAGRAKIDVTNAKIDKWTVQCNSIKAEYAAEADMPVLYDADNLFNSVYLVANPTTLATGTTLTFSGETDNYNFSKEVTLASDIIFPESQIAVINLALAETNLTNKVSYTWSKADLADIAGDDEVVIAMKTSDGYYTLTSEKGSSASPTAVSITVSDGELTGTPKAELIWNISNLSGTLTIYPKGQTAKWLYATDTNKGVRVGTGTYKDFSISGNYLKVKTDKTDRYLGIYSKQDWRCYENTTGNITGQTLCFFVKGNSKTALESPTNLSVSGTKTVSWDAVSGAASYNVTIGSETYTSETNSYDASAIEDEYYDVAVVAIPSDTDNYKKSAAATLTAAKFGTPTLTTPELKEGAVDETSVAVTWTVDERATEGYICEIYADETKVAADIVTGGSVAFSGLASGQPYTVKVYAKAVAGDKAYAASAVATIDLKTKPTYQVQDVTEAGTYTIKGLTVYAIANDYYAIVGDGTGYLLLYNGSKHGLAVGNTLDAAGSIKALNQVWKFDSPTISNKAAGSAPTYSGTVEATEDWLSAYATTSSVQYIHAKGTQSGRKITVGSQVLYLSAANSDTDGKAVEVYGFIYGYDTSYKNSNFVATSIDIDNTSPTLSIDKSAKTWAATETDAFVITVTVNSEGGDWTVSPETLDWASIVVNKTAGTITVTPNGENTAETAYESTLTVTHTSDASLSKTISLKQNVAGAAVETKVSSLVLSSSKKFGTSSGSQLSADDDASWIVTTSEGTIQNSYQSAYYGQQFGTSKASWTGYFTSDFTGKTVSKIEIVANTGSKATVAATVGGVAFGNAVSVTKKTNTEVSYTFEGNSAGGEIRLTVSDTKEAFYLGKIIVTYVE